MTPWGRACYRAAGRPRPQTASASGVAHGVVIGSQERNYD